MSLPENHQLIIAADRKALIEAAAGQVVRLCDAAVAERGHCHLALAGGNTPRGLYQTLAQPEFSEQMPWKQIDIFFGDERSVPPDHPDSNYRMAHESLLARAPVPAERIHPITARPGSIEEDARTYAHLIDGTLPTDDRGHPVFDLILLGIGDDGHTASLFPDTPILNQRDTSVAAVHVPKLDSWRISVTYPVLDAARHLLFLVSGAGKGGVMKQIVANESARPRFPVQKIRSRGIVDWYVDAAAASGLETN